MNWRSIAHVNLQTMTKLWNDSFEGYTVPIELTEEQLQHRIESLNLSSKSSFIAEVNNENAGIVLYGEEMFKGKKTAWIGGMGVIKPLRQHGVGKAMVEKTIEMARNDGIEQLHLEVIQGNVKAQKLYAQTGFEQVSEVSIGQLEVKQPFKKRVGLTLKLAKKNNHHEERQPKDTVWQNRLSRGYELYDIYVEQSCIGYLYWEKDKATIKQISLVMPKEELFEGVFAELVEQHQLSVLYFSNIDIKQPLYHFLTKYHYEERLRQSHMYFRFNKS